MELKNLESFIQVAELGSFTKAAKRLGYTQSTVSFQIRQLEEELGVPLFERIHHTVKLTAKGRSVQRLAQYETGCGGEQMSEGNNKGCHGGFPMHAAVLSRFYKLSPAVSGHFSDSDDRNNGGNVSDAESERSGSGVYSGQSYL